MNIITNEINAIFRDALDRQELAVIQARKIIARQNLDAAHAEALSLNALFDAVRDGDAQMAQLVAQLVEHAESTPLAALTDTAGDEPDDYLRNAIRDALGKSLGDAMDCTRVWRAWSVGTMTENDFSVIANDDERMEEIVEAVLAAIALAEGRAA